MPTQIDSYPRKSLLSLNTATRSDFRGRGLLKILANATFERYHDDYSCVVGVANSQSVGALTRHLGFTKIGNLELRFGRLYSAEKGRRVYSEDDLKWRCNNPKLVLRHKIYESNKAVIFFKPVKFLTSLKSIVPLTSVKRNSRKIPAWKKIGLTIDWRRDANPLIFLPKRLKPSPLALVFRPLSENSVENLTCWTLADFDAF